MIKNIIWNSWNTAYSVHYIHFDDLCTHRSSSMKNWSNVNNPFNMNVFLIVSHCEENKTTNEVMAHPHFFVILSWIGIWKYSNDRKLFKTIPQRLIVRIFEVFNIYDHEIVVRWEELLTPIFLTFVGLVERNVCIIECRNHVAEKNINTMVVT